MMTETILTDAALTETVIADLVAAAREAQASAYAFGLSVCAERVAIFHAVAAGRMDIAAIAVSTSAPKLCKPCGACRQVIAEFSRADNPIVIISTTQSGLSATETITDLLPDNFTLL